MEDNRKATNVKEQNFYRTVPGIIMVMARVISGEIWSLSGTQVLFFLQ